MALPQRRLGKDGPLVPALGFGAWQIGGGMGAVGEADAIATVRAAIDAGITLVDTAQGYRTSEAVLGLALRDGYRERCFLATKASGDYSPAAIQRALEDSLRALRVDHVDLYQIHNWRADQPIEDSLAVMQRARSAGKIRWIGVSNFDVAQLQRALRAAPVQSVQNRYNAIDRGDEEAVLPFCAAEGIGYLAHSALAKGLLGGRYTPATRFADDDERSTFRRFQGEEFAAHLALMDELKRVAAGKGITLVQLALAWILRRPEVTCVLVGARSPAQVAEQVAAARVTLTGEEVARIHSLLTRLPWTPERGPRQDSGRTGIVDAEERRRSDYQKTKQTKEKQNY